MKVPGEFGEIAGQKRRLRLERVERQASDLERFVKERIFFNEPALDLYSFLSLQEVDAESVIYSFFQAARDLAAATISGKHQHRRRALDRAEGALQSAKKKMEDASAPTLEDRRFMPVLLNWLECVGE